MTDDLQLFGGGISHSSSPIRDRWVLQIALSAGAPKGSLIAVWDGEAIGDAEGGTAHMVQIARAAGKGDLDVIKLKGGTVLAAGS